MYSFDDALQDLENGIKVKFVVLHGNKLESAVSISFHKCDKTGISETPLRGTRVVDMTNRYELLFHDEWPVEFEKRGISECVCIK